MAEVEEMDMDGNEPCATHLALQNELVLCKILNNLEMKDLITCAQLNLLWNKEAEKILHKKFTIKLKSMSEIELYTAMLENGGQLHDRIRVLVTLEEVEQLIMKNGREAFKILFDKIRPSIRIADILIVNTLESPSGCEDLHILLHLPGVEHLRISGNLLPVTENGELSFGSFSPEALLPDNAAYPELNNFMWNTHICPELTVDGENNLKGMPRLFRKLVSAAPNIRNVNMTPETPTLLYMFLQECEKVPGRLEKIESISTALNLKVGNFLLSKKTIPLKQLTLGIADEYVEVAENVLSKYAGTLSTLQVHESDRLDTATTSRRLVIPNMPKLESLWITMQKDWPEPDDTTLIQSIRLSNDDYDKAYPSLKKIIINDPEFESLEYFCNVVVPVGKKFSSVVQLTSSGDQLIKVIPIQKQDLYNRLVNMFPKISFELKGFEDSFDPD